MLADPMQKLLAALARLSRLDHFGVAVVVAGSCLGVLLLACFGSVVFGGRQFGLTDVAVFYYPLNLRIQQEWSAGRWPLWLPEANGGEPLLANPAAAVFYPGKLIYAVLPYAWAARIYIIAHVVLAFAAMTALLRTWRVSVTGALLGALSYAFAGPVLYQFANPIFLVGAAWLPLGFRAADRLVRERRRGAVVELAIVLALMVLGGDAEAAYLLIVCSGAYAVALSMTRASIVRLAPILAGAVSLYVIQIVLEGRIARARALALLGESEPGWLPSPRVVTIVVWLAVLAVYWRSGKRGGGLTSTLSRLAGACAVALALIGVQLVPTLELFGSSGRSAELGSHDVYPFSLKAPRVLEWIWPNFSGTIDRGNRWWHDCFPPTRADPAWCNSLYLGGISIAAAFGVFGFRGGPPWRAWLSAIAVASLLGSLGEYSSPLLWARQLWPASQMLGPPDPSMSEGLRVDGYLRDGDGGFYWFLGALLPGFGSFRFPSKLLAFTSLSLAALAGLGWDRIAAGNSVRVRNWARAFLAISLLAVAAIVLGHSPFERFLTSRAGDLASTLGAFDVPGTIHEIRASLLQALVVFTLALVLIRWAPRQSALAGVAALAVLTADLCWANARTIQTVPQSLFDEPPRLQKLIADAERSDPAPGPFRIQRMPVWFPPAQVISPSPHKNEDMVRWTRDTLLAEFGLPYGLQYAFRKGTTEIFDAQVLFTPYTFAADEHTASALGCRPGTEFLYYPRRAFDMWGARYFVVPATIRLNDPNRDVTAFVAQTETLAPDAATLADQSSEVWKRWVRTEDIRLLRNLNAYPRAWVVHRARLLKPIEGQNPADRKALLDQIFYPNDVLWHSPNRRVNDPRQMAWVETDDFASMAPYLSQQLPDRTESVKVASIDPQHVELTVTLKSPGIVVLAETFYPGWTLTIDDRPAPILRVNRLMRGAAVPAGSHLLVYRYRPQSFYAGAMITCLGFLAVGGLCVRNWRVAA